ncbi:unnamed protein product, partial [Musa banksii]
RLDPPAAADSPKRRRVAFSPSPLHPFCSSSPPRSRRFLKDPTVLAHVPGRLHHRRDRRLPPARSRLV